MTGTTASFLFPLRQSDILPLIGSPAATVGCLPRRKDRAVSFPASNNGPAGICVAHNDVCKTPVQATPNAASSMAGDADAGPAVETEVPVAYTNVAALQQATLATLAQKVFIVGKPAATTNTEIWMSTGNEAGTGGGVVSGSVGGPCRIKVGSRKVFVEGHGGAYLGVMVAHNNTANSNMPIGNQVHASQTKVFFGP